LADRQKVPALAAIRVILMVVFSIYPGGYQQTQELNNFMQTNFEPISEICFVGFIGFMDSVWLKVRTGFMAFSSDLMLYFTENLRELTLYSKTYFH
jgi:hypothetical protein